MIIFIGIALRMKKLLGKRVMKLLIIFKLLGLLLFVQIACSQGNKGQQTTRSEKKSKAYTLDLGRNEERFNSEIDLKNKSQFREVEYSENGLVVLTNYGSFRLFKENIDNTWSEIKLSEGIYCLDFQDGKNGWVVDWKGGVWHTFDGARDWKQIGNVSGNASYSMCEALQFTSPDTGWLAGLSGLFKTEDGGKTWNKVSHVSENADDLFFINQGSGWVTAVDENNKTTFFLTSNGGLSWTSKETDKLAIDEIFLNTFQNGWIIGGAGEVFTTNNRGVTWEKAQGFENNFLAKSIFCLDDQTCFVAGYTYKKERESNPSNGNAALFKTINNGQSWSKVNLNSNEHFFEKVKFFNPNFGILAAQNSLYKTTDGGNSWVEILNLKINQ